MAKKSSNLIKRDIFRVLAVVFVIASLICGILFATVEVTRFTSSFKIVTEEVFEWWKALMFWFIGLIGGATFLGISSVFDELEKIKNINK